jgi:hypothetical protein
VAYAVRVREFIIGLTHRLRERGLADDPRLARFCDALDTAEERLRHDASTTR